MFQRLQVRSGGEHYAPAFAVRVRRVTLRSSACSRAAAEEQEAGGRRQ